MIGTVQRDARYRTFDLVTDECKAPRRASCRFGEYFLCLDMVCHFQLRFMLARLRLAKSEAARAAKLRVNSPKIGVENRPSKVKSSRSIRRQNFLPIFSSY